VKHWEIHKNFQEPYWNSSENTKPMGNLNEITIAICEFEQLVKQRETQTYVKIIYKLVNPKWNEILPRTKLVWSYCETWNPRETSKHHLRLNASLIFQRTANAYAEFASMVPWCVQGGPKIHCGEYILEEYYFRREDLHIQISEL
jgi:hypothetical protein